MKRVVFLIIAIFCIFIDTYGQKKIKYKAAGAMEFLRINGEKVRKLDNNVIFIQNTTTIFCDSAYLYQKRNDMEAFGNIKIVDDSVTITAQRLYYSGNNRKAELRGDVIYTKGQYRLSTQNLDYEMDKEISYYFEGGTLRDSTNTLSSLSGYYYAQSNYATFSKEVQLLAPTYTLKSEDLTYNTLSKIATTHTRTEIISNENKSTIHSQGGEFRTEKSQSTFTEGKVFTDENTLSGNELFYDKIKKYYKAEGNVNLANIKEELLIVGDEGFYDKNKNLSVIWGNPIMKKPLQSQSSKIQIDTLFLAADTLKYFEKDSVNKIVGYHNIKIFKSDLQGYADSLVYLVSDSIIILYKNPILWHKNNQLEADTIKISIVNKNIDKMYLQKNAFIGSKNNLKTYNQIKGRNMLIYFKNENIDKMKVMGNGEIIYYLLSQNDSLMIGMNRIICSDIVLNFENQTVSNISAYKKPEGKFIPPHELTPNIQILEGFEWKGENRTTLQEIFEETPKKQPEKKEKDNLNEKIYKFKK